MTAPTIQKTRLELPLFPGKGFPIRALNGLRRRLPRLCHFAAAVLRLAIRDRYSAMTWTAILRPAPGRSKIVVDTYADALRELLAVGGKGEVTLGGLHYRVNPTRGTGFATETNNIVRRTYETYDDYLNHQQSKLARESGFVHRTSEKRFGRMHERFSRIADEAGLSGTVLCLAARLGEEVRAFREIGLLAVGIDLNPGEGNKYTMYGDFHDLAFPDSVFDVIFSNSLDHVLDLDRFMSEAVRVVKPEGRIYFDLSGGYGETGTIDPYGASFWKTNDELIAALRPYIKDLVLNDSTGRNKLRLIVFTPRKDHATKPRTIPNGAEPALNPS